MNTKCSKCSAEYGQNPPKKCKLCGKPLIATIQDSPKEEPTKKSKQHTLVD